MIQQQFIGERRIESIVEARVDERRRQWRVARHAAPGKSQPLFDGTVVVVGAADAKGSACY